MLTIYPRIFSNWRDTRDDDLERVTRSFDHLLHDYSPFTCKPIKTQAITIHHANGFKALCILPDPLYELSTFSVNRNIPTSYTAESPSPILITEAFPIIWGCPSYVSLVDSHANSHVPGIRSR